MLEPTHKPMGNAMPPMANQTKMVTGIKTRVARNAAVDTRVATAVKPAPGNRKLSAAAR